MLAATSRPVAAMPFLFTFIGVPLSFGGGGGACRLRRRPVFPVSVLGVRPRGFDPAARLSSARVRTVSIMLAGVACAAGSLWNCDRSQDLWSDHGTTGVRAVGSRLVASSDLTRKPTIRDVAAVAGVSRHRLPRDQRRPLGLARGARRRRRGDPHDRVHDEPRRAKPRDRAVGLARLPPHRIAAAALLPTPPSPCSCAERPRRSLSGR